MIGNPGGYSKSFNLSLAHMAACILLYFTIATTKYTISYVDYYYIHNLKAIAKIRNHFKLYHLTLLEDHNISSERRNILSQVRDRIIATTAAAIR